MPWNEGHITNPRIGFDTWMVIIPCTLVKNSRDTKGRNFYIHMVQNFMSRKQNRLIFQWQIKNMMDLDFRISDTKRECQQNMLNENIPFEPVAIGDI